MRGRRLIAVVIVATLSLAVRQRPPRDVLPELPHERVDYWVDQFSHTPEYRKKIAQAFERKPKVEKLLRKKLRERGMPESLIYLAMEESAFNVEAHSRSEAVGVWQLTKDTARLYHLRVDKHHDERRNLSKETDAALEFLSHLYDRFGCWYIAAAAYNCGEHRVARIMTEAMGREEGRDRDYYKIWKKLPDETRDYVPAIIALKKIAKDPKKYGF
jgi:membrane-bound lytic murein transglycosylase D